MPKRRGTAGSYRQQGYHLGEVDKNELKEKQTSNWKKYLTFSFGNTNKEKPEEKEQPQEKEKLTRNKYSN